MTRTLAALSLSAELPPMVAAGARKACAALPLALKDSRLPSSTVDSAVASVDVADISAACRLGEKNCNRATGPRRTLAMLSKHASPGFCSLLLVRKQANNVLNILVQGSTLESLALDLTWQEEQQLQI